MKTNNKIKQVVQETLDQISSEPLDDMINLESLEKKGIDRGALHSRKAREAVDEIAIDEIFAGIPSNEGYYLKLYRVKPGSNEWEYKERFDKFHNWTDAEDEINKYVREKTKLSPTKWGTGEYIIDIYKRGGIRGEKYEPRHFHIDAQEELLPTINNNNGHGHNELKQDMTTIMETFKNINDPVEYQKRLTEVFQAGQLSKTGEGNSTVAMMTTMMQQAMESNRQNTTLMLGILDKANNKPMPIDSGTDKIIAFLTALLPSILPLLMQKPSNILDEIGKLQANGLLAKPSDPMSQLTQLKTVLDIAKGLAGSDREKSTIEVLADTFAPLIPQVLDTVKQGIDLQKQSLNNTITTNSSTPLPAPVIPNSNLTEEEQVKQIWTGLKTAIENQDKNIYPMLKSIILSKTGGKNLIDNIISDTITDEHLVMMIKQGGTIVGLDNPQYENSIKTYMQGFILYVKNQIQSPTQSPTDKSKKIKGICSQCKTEYDYENKEDYMQDNKTCSELVNEDFAHQGIPCTGTIILNEN